MYICLQIRINSDVERFEKERLELQDRVNMLQQQVYKGSEKLDQFKLLMNWNQEELEQWAVAQKQKEDDNQALEKYRCGVQDMLWLVLVQIAQYQSVLLRGRLLAAPLGV